LNKAEKISPLKRSSTATITQKATEQVTISNLCVWRFRRCMFFFQCSKHCSNEYLCKALNQRRKFRDLQSDTNPAISPRKLEYFRKLLAPPLFTPKTTDRKFEMLFCQMAEYYLVKCRSVRCFLVEYHLVRCHLVRRCLVKCYLVRRYLV